MFSPPLFTLRKRIKIILSQCQKFVSLCIRPFNMGDIIMGCMPSCRQTCGTAKETKSNKSIFITQRSVYIFMLSLAVLNVEYCTSNKAVGER